MLDMSQPYIARRTFSYVPGVDLMMGEVFNLRPNMKLNANEQLERLRYFEPLARGQKPFECRICGRRFASLQFLNVHGGLHHPAVIDESIPAEAREEKLAEQIDAIEERMSPLAMDQTAATKDPAAARHEATEKRSGRKYL